MPRIALVVHPYREAAKELAERSRRWWETRGFDVVETMSETSFVSSELLRGDLAFAVSLGGDGTMLRTVQLVLKKGVPVLGVNLGNLGYLTQVEPSKIEDAFGKLLAGEFRIEERLTLELTCEDDTHAVSRFLVVNEASVEKTRPGHTVHLGVSISGRPFLTYVSDGLVVATPTGSTAYNLSLRGPIVSPTLQAVVLTPVSPHMLFDRSLVLGPNEPVRLEVLDGRPAVLVIDGSIIQPLDVGSVVNIEAGHHVARIVDFGSVEFHSVLRAKFGLSDR